MPSRTGNGVPRPIAAGRADTREVSLRLLLWGPVFPVLALLGLLCLS